MTMHSGGWRRAFSLIEMLFALGLMALLLGLSMVNLRPATAKAQARGAAEILAAALRGARQKAIASGRPVAVAIPSQGGTRPLSQSFYTLEGEVTPKSVRGVNLAGEFPQAVITAATYPGPTWNNSPEVGSSPFSFSNWAPPHPLDPTVVFLPGGQAVANLSTNLGHYCLVTGGAVKTSGSPAVIEQIRDPFTVRVTWAGEVAVEAGLVGGQSSLINDNTPLDTSQIARLQPAAGGANHAPAFVAPYLSIEPNPIDASRTLIVPSPANATVALDGTLTLTIYARDADGDTLSCAWEGRGPAGSGSFSSPGGHRLRWDQEAQSWYARTSWRPPEKALPEEHYILNCTLFDEQGASTPLQSVIQLPDIYTLPKGRLVYATGTEIWSCNWDGTNAVRLVRAAQLAGSTNPRFPKWSPDGSKIAFLTTSDGGIWCVNRDGSDAHLMRITGNNLQGLQWDPTGRRIFLLESNVGSNYLAVRAIRANVRNSPVAAGVVTDLNSPGIFSFLSSDPGASVFISSRDNHNMAVLWKSPASATQLPVNWVEPNFTPDGKDIIFSRGAMLGRSKVTVDAGTQTLTLGPEDLRPTGVASLNSPIQSPDGKWIIAQSGYVPPIRLVLMRSDGSGARVVPLPNNVADDFDWSWR